MKKLVVMRHAKSSFDQNGLADIDRPLNKRGEKDAHRMGKLMKDKGICPDAVFSSKAVRAAATAEVIAEGCDLQNEIVYVDKYYLGEPETYLAPLRELNDDKVRTVLIVGHNPGLETLVQLFSDKVESLPTGAVAVIELPIRHSKSVSLDLEGKLKELWRPRDIK